MRATFGLRQPELPLFKTLGFPPRVLNRNPPADTSRFEKRWFRPPHSKCLNILRLRYNGERLAKKCVHQIENGVIDSG